MSQDNKNNNVIDFTEKLESIQDLRDYAKAQYFTLLACNKRIQELEEENQVLNKQLQYFKEAQEDNKTQIIPRSNEQDICEVEIYRLKEKALTSSLSLEDTKKLDLLVKNLHAIKEKNLDKTPKPKKPKLSNEELIKLATLPKENE